MGLTNQVWGNALRGLEAITEKGIWQEEIFEAENENTKEKCKEFKCLCSISPCSEHKALKQEVAQQKFSC